MTENFEDDFTELLNITNKILKDFPNGVFIKLNTRSPKDVPHFEIESIKSQSNCFFINKI